jgi:superfamily II helicase
LDSGAGFDDAGSAVSEKVVTDPPKEDCECCGKEFDADELTEWNGVYFNGSMVCAECARTLAMEE